GAMSPDPSRRRRTDIRCASSSSAPRPSSPPASRRGSASSSPWARAARASPWAGTTTNPSRRASCSSGSPSSASSRRRPPALCERSPGACSTPSNPASPRRARRRAHSGGHGPPSARTRGALAGGAPLLEGPEPLEGAGPLEGAEQRRGRRSAPISARFGVRSTVMVQVPQDLALVAGLSRRELAELDDVAAERRLSPGDLLVREGAQPEELYVLLSGSLEVLRCDRRGAEYVLGDIGPGGLVGELAAVEERPCSATVRATEPSRVLVLPAAAIRARPRLVTNIARAIAERLRAQSELSLEYMQERAAMGELLVKSMVLLCAYAVLLSATPWVRSTWPNVSTTVLSLPVIALFGAFSYRFIRATGWPLSRFGL